MKRLLLSLSICMTMFIGSAQSIITEKELSHAGSVSASECPSDNNGNPCAKIIIELPLNDVVIEGSYIIGNVTHSVGQYELFVSIPKKMGQVIRVRHNKFKSVEIPLWVNESALVGRQAYRAKLFVKDKFSDYNRFYVDAFFQAIGLMGAGGTIGAHFHGVNAELEFVKGLEKTDDVFWYDQNKLIAKTSYSAVAGNLKIGYGFQAGNKLHFTPQIGVGLVKCSSEGSNPGEKANSAFALVGLRCNYVFANHLQLVVAPYYNFAVKKSSSFEEIAGIDSAVDKWTNGINIKVGLSIFF